MGSASPVPVPSVTEVPTVSDVVNDGLSMATEATNQFIENLPVFSMRLLLAGAVLIIGYLLLRIGRRLIGRVIRKKEGITMHTRQQRDTMRSLVQSVFSYLMYFVIATVVLSIFGVNISSIIAVAGVGGVAIGFGAQTLVKDVISGIFLWAEGNLIVGDTVQVNSMTGMVESISLRTTTVRDFNGCLYIIPNGDIRTVVNMNRTYRRAEVAVRLSYEERLDDMLAILGDEMEKSRDAVEGLRDTPQVLGITDMAGDCITVKVAALCEPAQVTDVERALRMRILQRFAKERILFPHAPVMATPRWDEDAQ